MAQRGYALWKFDPQIRHLGYLRWETQTGYRWAKTLRATTSINRSVEERVTQREATSLRRHEREAVNTYGAQLEVVSEPTASYRMVSGIEYYADRVHSGVYEEDITTATRATQRSTYPARSAGQQLGAVHPAYLVA